MHSMNWGLLPPDKAVITVGVAGDVNTDGKLTAADLVMLQKWLIQSGSINNGRLGDLDGNGILNGIDLAMLRSLLIR
ncbi:MAG: dockerin type I repeat-containing protein [Ruminococcus callidus]